MADLSITIAGVLFKNPVMTASGTYGYGDEYSDLYDPSTLGAVASKGLTLDPREGNPPPRIWETPAGLLNSIGLNNMGMKHFITNKCPELEAQGISVLANIAGKTIEEFGEMAALCNTSSAIKAVEVNVSCPNVHEGGMAFGLKCENINAVTRTVKKYTAKPVIVKLSPNVTDITEMAGAAIDGGADGLTLINTLLGMAIDIHTWKPIFHNTVAGLSGPAIKPVALRMVYQVKKKYPHIPIIGVGGIATLTDAIEFFLAGASAIQVGTALFNDPMLPVRLIEEINTYCDARGLKSLQDMIGKAIR